MFKSRKIYSEASEKEKIFFDEKFADQFDEKMNMYDLQKRLKVVFEKLLTPEEIKGKTLLDAGCGTGWFSQRACELGAQVTSLDMGEGLLSRVAQKCNSRRIVGDILNLEFPDNTFDIVLCSEVIEHTSDPQRAFAELSRVLKKGGLLALTVPNARWRILIRIANAFGLRPYQGYENWVEHSQLKSWSSNCHMKFETLFGFHFIPFLISRLQPISNYFDTYGLRLRPFMLNIACRAVKTGSEEKNCCFCGGRSLELTHQGYFHQIKKDHGPVDFYRCLNCGSGLTIPPPSNAQLNELYQSFDGGMSEKVREIRNTEPQTQWYEQCARNVGRLAKKNKDDVFTWLDVGAGGGEFSEVMNKTFPKSRGLAIDLHSAPSDFAKLKSVAWKRCDINQDEFASEFSDKFHVVTAISIWEHVKDPDAFVRNLMSLVSPGGTLYLACPNYGSRVRKVLRRHWPFFLPGEHLFIPSLDGARHCLRKHLENKSIHSNSYEIFVNSIPLPYTLRYVFKYFRLGFLAAILPRKAFFPLPAGMLEAGLQSPVNIHFHTDDIGATSSSTQKIIVAWEKGLLDGFSIIVNGQGIEAFKKALLRNPERKAHLGVHLNLSNGRPLAPLKDVTLLVNRNGILKHSFLSILLKWLISSKEKREMLSKQIEQEWRSQIRIAKQVCHPRSIHTLDGHNHIHMLPFLFPIAAKLAQEEGIPSMRVSREVFFFSSSFWESMRLGFLKNIIKHFILKFCARYTRPLVKKYNLDSPDALLGVLYSGTMSKTSVQSGIKAVKQKGLQTLEILFHIGRSEEDECRKWQEKSRPTPFFLSMKRDLEAKALEELRRQF